MTYLEAIDRFAAIPGFPKDEAPRETLARLLQEVIEEDKLDRFVLMFVANYSPWPGAPTMLQVAKSLQHPDAGAMKEWTAPKVEPDNPPICATCGDRWIIKRAHEGATWEPCPECPDGREYGPKLAAIQNSNERSHEQRKREGKPIGLRRPSREEMNLVLNDIMRRRRDQDNPLPPEPPNVQNKG